MKLSIILPAYNEEANLKRTVTSIAEYCDVKQYLHEILIVDDGSTDRTAEITHVIAASNPHVSLLSHESNRGKGAAVRTGVQSATGDIVAFLDADGSTPVSELDAFFPYLDAGYDIVIGSRYLAASTITRKQPLLRTVIGRIGNLIIQLLLLPGIVDTQCGCKVFTREAAQKLFTRQRIDGWGFDMEILAIARLHELRIKEIPVSWCDATNRSSRFRPIKDLHRTLVELYEIKMSILRGHYR